MTSYACASCKGKIPEHTIKWSSAHPDGWVVCPHCRTRLAVKEQSRSQKWAFLIGLLAMIVLVPLMHRDSIALKLAAGLGVLIFLISIVYSSSKSLVVIERRQL